MDYVITQLLYKKEKDLLETLYMPNLSAQPTEELKPKVNYSTLLSAAMGKNKQSKSNWTK